MPGKTGQGDFWFCGSQLPLQWFTKDNLAEAFCFPFDVSDEFLLADFVVCEDGPELFVVLVLTDILLCKRCAAGDSMTSTAQTNSYILSYKQFCLFVFL